MTQGKVELTIGRVAFSAEGAETWLAEQLDKIIDVATTLASTPDSTVDDDPGESVDASSAVQGDFKTSLVNYIREKKGETNQVQRFLATADWLRRRGIAVLTTAVVAKTLTDNHQKRLANPADCLNKNVSKGYCEKTKDGFFITPDGLKHLGSE